MSLHWAQMQLAYCSWKIADSRCPTDKLIRTGLEEIETQILCKGRRMAEVLEANHQTAPELLVGFYKTGSGRPSITWPEAVDQALCFGWIDGVRNNIDEVSYSIRFSPRRAGSIWSAKNIARVRDLDKQVLMHPNGLKAFAARDEKKSRIYAYEQKTLARLSPFEAQEFRRDKKAWQFFEKRPPWYQRTALCWVVSAKKTETRQKRLKTLIDDSRHQRTVAPLTPRKAKRPHGSE